MSSTLHKLSTTNCGDYSDSGPSYYKVEVPFPNDTQKYHTTLIFDGNDAWVARHYSTDEFDCEDENATPNKFDVIAAIANTDKLLITYNICGVYKKSNPMSHKIRVMFPNNTNVDTYDINLLFNECVAWLSRNYPKERIVKDEFDLDCEGEFECADNNDIIVAPCKK